MDMTICPTIDGYAKKPSKFLHILWLILNICFLAISICFIITGAYWKGKDNEEKCTSTKLSQYLISGGSIFLAFSLTMFHNFFSSCFMTEIDAWGDGEQDSFFCIRTLICQLIFGIANFVLAILSILIIKSDLKGCSNSLYVFGIIYSVLGLTVLGGFCLYFPIASVFRN
ncbi:hypothetical protein M0811_01037 [Anaeramoeba ignava]|uniref:Uncharacterized protein n=1 Tax=Anaeramoeba ignava TaxID=1746090 RepID=A0A9Q0LKB3_ANAIG|nr:hypothetical protein M0811_01037 [Anaeramoeba ignava]